MNYPHPILAREGWPIMGAALVLSAVVTWLAGWLWALPLWVFTVFSIQFFRDPKREVPAEPNVVVSPVDGRVLKIVRCENPYTGEDSLMISVFMNVFNVHCQKAPVAGEVLNVEYHAGKFLNAALEKASTENERNAVTVRMDDGRTMTVVQVAGLVARRVLCYCQKGDRLERGQRYGFIRFGSRADLYLPVTARPRVTIGQKVAAPTTVLASLGDK